MAERALILDDNPSKAKLINLWLLEQGIDCDIIFSYEDAVKHSDIKYNYLILDYFLEGGNTGSDFADYYQSKHFDCTVYLYSAFPDQIVDIRPVMDFSLLKNYLRARLPLEATDYDVYLIAGKLESDRT